MSSSPTTTLDDFVLDRMREVLAEHSEQLLRDLRDMVHQEVRAALADFRPPTNADEWLPVKAASCITHRPEKTIRKWIRTGALKAKRIGAPGKERIYMVRRVDLDAFLNRADVPARPVPDEREQLRTILAGVRKRADRASDREPRSIGRRPAASAE
jgi:hypothetical protein